MKNESRPNESKLPQVGAWLTILAFGYLLVELTSHAIPLNPATWVMWTVLDVFLARTMKNAGQSGASMMTAFAVGAGLIAMMAFIQLFRGETSWTWGAKETLTAGCFVATFIARRYSASETLSMNMGATAMFIAAAPTMIDSWHNPKAQDPIFWGACAIGWVITLMGTKRSVAKWYLPMGGAITNGFIAVLAMGFIK